MARYKILHFPLDLSVQAVLHRDGLLKRCKDHDHIHYFSKETALATLEDTGYKPLDYFCAPRSNGIGSNLIQKLFRVPRILLFTLHRDFAVRLLGGYSLMILSE